MLGSDSQAPCAATSFKIYLQNARGELPKATRNRKKIEVHSNLHFASEPRLIISGSFIHLDLSTD